MYINDPFELMLKPKLASDIEYDEPRDYHDYFWDDQQMGPPRYADDEIGIYSDICVFDSSGDHLYMAENCPHFDAEDEEGKRIVPGWTAQQGWQ